MTANQLLDLLLERYPSAQIIDNLLIQDLKLELQNIKYQFGGRTKIDNWPQIRKIIISGSK